MPKPPGTRRPTAPRSAKRSAGTSKRSTCTRAPEPPWTRSVGCTSPTGERSSTTSNTPPRWRSCRKQPIVLGAPSDHELLAAVALTADNPWALGADYQPDVLALLEEALAAVGNSNPALRVRLLEGIATNLYYIDADREGTAAHAALQIAEEIGRPIELATAHRAVHLWLTHQPEARTDRLAAARRAYHLERAARDNAAPRRLRRAPRLHCGPARESGAGRVRGSARQLRETRRGSRQSRRHLLGHGPARHASDHARGSDDGRPARSRRAPSGSRARPDLRRRVLPAALRHSVRTSTPRRADIGSRGGRRSRNRLPRRRRTARNRML